MKKVKCRICDQKIEQSRTWTLCGRDYDNPIYFCSDSCRMIFPFKFEVETNC